ncbi:MAG: hypothetical protein OQJ77_07410 [Thiovulaceae bacterium]|nr:hypothetical protein [Sulfurimonadaceae bacterium]
MRKYMEIEKQVIDIDGSCRDINFPDVGKSEAISLLNLLKMSCELKSANDSEGAEISSKELMEHVSSSDKETISSYWLCQGLVSQVQVFLSWTNDSKIFIEITFFPQDVDSKTYTLEAFLEWLKPFLVSLNTSDYFVRYENASWNYGDTSEKSGVIFSNSQYAMNG